MLTPMSIAVALLVGYVIGSVPVANTYGARLGLPDLRTVGDHNPGFWNASVLAGRPIWPVLVGDAAKGAVAAVVGSVAGSWTTGAAAVAAAIVGHCWPVFAGFRGGRGVATFAGGVAVLSPVAAGIAAISGGLFAAASRRIEWGIRLAVFATPVIMLATDGPPRTAAIGAMMTLIGTRFRSASRHAPTRPR